MKKKLLLLLVVLVAAAYQTNAQTTRKSTTKKSTSKSTQKSKPVTVKQQPVTKAAPVPAGSQARIEGDYTTALGLKFIYGISVTGKHFIKNSAALEAIVRYRNYGSGIGSEFNFSGLYEYHAAVPGAPGLKWYAGGGVYLGHASFDYVVTSTFSYGPTGVIGLEYKFKDIPLALSADWQPVFLINSGGGFAAENGGIGVKYAF